MVALVQRLRWPIMARTDLC